MSRGKNKVKLHEVKAQYTGARVIYTKYGSRHGWEGTVKKVYAKGGLRIDVLFDNGVLQDYRLDALHLMPKSWGTPEVYLSVIK